MVTGRRRTAILKTASLGDPEIERQNIAQLRKLTPAQRFEIMVDLCDFGEMIRKK